MKSLTLILVFISALAFSQGDSLNLSDCYRIAGENYPLIKQKGLLENASVLRLQNYAQNYLPGVSFNGQATYQSDVTQVSITMPEIPGIGQLPSPEMPDPAKDQYKLTLDVSQTIWDGGMTKAQKELEGASLEADMKQVEVDLYKLSSQINSIFFSVLSLQSTSESLTILRNEIGEKISVAASTIKNGVGDSTTVQILMAEQLKIDQQIIEIESARKASVFMLEKLLSFEIDEKVVFSTPLPDQYESPGKRPEYELFETSRKKLDAGINLLSKKNSPMFFGFGQFGYGKPGLNMFSDEFDSFYIVGAKVTWSITDMWKTSRDRKIFNIQKDMVGVQEELFKNAQDVQIEKEKADIEKYKQLIVKSREILKLRESIALKSSSRFENGIITANDYLVDQNAKTQSQISYENYLLQLVKARINLLTLSGNLKYSENENQ